MFRHADIRVVAVAQDVDIEMRSITRGFHRFPRGAQPREYAVNVLVTDRHDQRGAVLRV
ncbi:hypothetical protein D3C76_1733280 [compost metagenome]